MPQTDLQRQQHSPWLLAVSGFKEQSWFLAWELPSTYLTVRYKEIPVIPKNRVVCPSESLPQVLDLENFATAR